MDCKIKSFLIKEQTVMRIEILFVLHLCYHEFCKTFKLVLIPAKASLKYFDHELKRITSKSYIS